MKLSYNQTQWLQVLFVIAALLSFGVMVGFTLNHVFRDNPTCWIGKEQVIDGTKIMIEVFCK